MLSQDLHQEATHAVLVKARRQSTKRKAAVPAKSKGRMPSASPSAQPAIEPMTSGHVMPACADCSTEAKARTSTSSSEGLPSLSALCQMIREAHRRRQDFLRPEGNLTRTIKSIERRYFKGASGHSSNDDRRLHAAAPDLSSDEGQCNRDDHPNGVDIAPSAELGEDPTAPVDQERHVDAKLALYLQPLVDSRDQLTKQRKDAEKHCQKLAKKLPVYAWVEGINGFGALGLAQIVGECGDLSNYSNPAKVWKRMGLHVVDGKAARKSKAKGDIMGYSPIRRSISWNIGSSLLKKQNPYRELYLTRKVFEQQKVPDGTKMLWHRRAQRYAEKRLLRDLWRAWRDQR